MVGVWQADHAVFRDEGVRTSIGADHYVASLRDGVVRILHVATGEPHGPSAEAAVVTLMPQQRGGNGGSLRRLRRPA